MRKATPTSRSMVSTDRSDGPQIISQDDAAYFSRMSARLGAVAPQSITIVGDPAPLSGPLTAFLCSKDTPGGTILKAFDQAAAWRDAERFVISGFHSPLERQCLDILLRGKQPVVIALARGMGALRLSATQKKALYAGRLTIISSFPATEKRTTRDLAIKRNRFIAALADEVVFAFLSPGGSLTRLAEQITADGGTWRQLHCENI